MGNSGGVPQDAPLSDDLEIEHKILDAMAAIRDSLLKNSVPLTDVQARVLREALAEEIAPRVSGNAVSDKSLAGGGTRGEAE